MYVGLMKRKFWKIMNKKDINIEEQTDCQNNVADMNENAQEQTTEQTSEQSAADATDTGTDDTGNADNSDNSKNLENPPRIPPRRNLPSNRLRSR